MAHINTFNNHPGATFTDNSLTITAQQNNTAVDVQPQVTSDSNAEEAHSNASGKSRPIYFAGKRGQKINLYRVILALHECGFFSDGNGGKPRQEDVFNAFGAMLHEDFSNFSKNLSEAKKVNNDSPAPEQIFEALKNTYIEIFNA